jgi:hypothetical protein
MLRILAETNDGRPLVLLGLDDTNLARLKQDQPIVVNLRHLNPDDPDNETDLPDIDVSIFFAGDYEVKLLRERFGS